MKTFKITFFRIFKILIPLFGKIMADVHFIISQATLEEPTPSLGMLQLSHLIWRMPHLHFGYYIITLSFQKNIVKKMLI